MYLSCWELHLQEAFPSRQKIKGKNPLSTQILFHKALRSTAGRPLVGISKDPDQVRQLDIH